MSAPKIGEWTFEPRWHVLWLAGYHDARRGNYRAWWEALPAEQRAAYEAELERYLEVEEERGRHEAAVKAERERERVRLVRLAALERRGVPAKDIELIAGGLLRETPALEAAQAMVREGLRALVLSGPKGCGKTTAASWLVAEDLPRPTSYEQELFDFDGGLVSFDLDHRRREPPGRPTFVDVSRLARLSRYREEDMRPLETALLLAIDDLGAEFNDEKGSFLATLDGLFNARYAERLYTVITTNLPAKAFKERYGERIADRIREVGRFVELDGKSLRVRAAAERPALQSLPGGKP